MSGSLVSASKRVMKRIFVFNPNSSKLVTSGFDATLDGLRAGCALQIDCATNENGPSGIETDAHVAEVVPAVLGAIRAAGADIAVVACFSDPGVEAARAASGHPVIGIAEAAYLTAMGLAGRFGVVSIVDASIRRHAVRLRDLGFISRLAGDRAINVSVDDLQQEGVMERLVVVGMALRDQDQAEAIILGCAGLGTYRAALQAALRIPVIDPVQAAVAQAATFLSLDLVATR